MPASGARIGIQVILDLDDGRNRLSDFTEKFQTHGADMRRHLVQHEGRFGDDAVAALFLHAGQPRQELVGDVLAEPEFAELRARNLEDFLTDTRFSVALVARDAELHQRHVVYLAQVVAEAFNVHPPGIGGDHAPAGKIVERCSPQYGFLAAGVHGDVTADARSVG